MYTDVESGYIKRKIKTVSWANRSYIDDLIQLYKFIREHPNGFAANLCFHRLKQQLPGDYLELVKEYSQEQYEQELEKMRVEGERLEVQRREAEKRENALKEDWLRAGGAL